MSSTTISSLITTTTTSLIVQNTSTAPPPPTTSAATEPDWPGARIFAASVAAIYMTLAFVTMILFVRKMRQTCEIMNRHDDEQRLLNNRDHNLIIGGAAGIGGGGGGGGNAGGIIIAHSDAASTRASSHYGAGDNNEARNISGRDRQLHSEDFKRYYGGGGVSVGAGAGRNQLGTGYYGGGNSYQPTNNSNANGGGGGQSAVSRPFAQHRPSVPDSDDVDGYGVGTPGVGGGRGGGGLAGLGANDVTRSTIGSNLDYYGNNPGVAPTPSDIVVEVRSHAGSDTGGGGDTATVTDRGGASSMSSRFPSRLGDSSSCCETCGCGSRCYCCLRPIAALLTHCCCLPASYFAERHRSSLLLLGSMFFYSLSRFGQIVANVVDYGDENQGANSLYQGLVTAIPACMLLLLQLSFNLKWVVNVRNISASGAPEGSRLSLGPSRSALSITRGNSGGGGARRNGQRSDSNIPVDEDDPESPCSCDIGTLTLSLGVCFLVIAPIFSVFCLLAYLDANDGATHHGHNNNNADDDANVYFLNLSHALWEKLLTGVYAVPYTLNGLSCLFLAFVLKAVWKPFSEVAMRASVHMFAVAAVWGGLCFVRGILLLSYELPHFDHATHSPYAGPSVLVAEGCLIYLVVLIFFLASRNQDQVIAAEKEARTNLERGLGRSGPGGLNRKGRGFGNNDNDDDDDDSDDDSDDSDNDVGALGGNDLTQSGRLRLGSNRMSNSDLDAMNNNNKKKDKTKDGKKKKNRNNDKPRKGKGLDAAGGNTSHNNNNNNNKQGLGLPVYSTWSSQSQVPSRAVSENLAGRGVGNHLHNQHQNQNRHNTSEATTRSSIATNNTNANDNSNQNFHLQDQQQQPQMYQQSSEDSLHRLGGVGLLHHNQTNHLQQHQHYGSSDAMNGDEGQPTQSRLFYED